MTEAIMVFSNDRAFAFTQNITDSNRLDLHGLLQFCAGIFISLGFASIYFSKIQLNDDEEPSFHSNVGYTACILAGGAFFGGVLAKFGGWLKLPVKLIRIIHAFFGTLTYYLALNAICSGLYSSWLQSHVSLNIIYGLMGVVILIGMNTIYRPVRSIYTRVKVLFSKSKPNLE